MIKTIKNLMGAVEQVKVKTHYHVYESTAEIPKAKVDNILKDSGGIYTNLLLGWSWNMVNRASVNNDSSIKQLNFRMALMASKNDDSDDSSILFTDLFSNFVFQRNDADVVWADEVTYSTTNDTADANNVNLSGKTHGQVMLPQPIVVPSLCLWVAGLENNMSITADFPVKLYFTVYYSRVLCTFDLIEKITRTFQSFGARR